MAHRSLPHYQRRHIVNNDLIESIDRIGLKLADCLSIAESALDTFVQCRPPSDPHLSEVARQTLGIRALPFGLANIAATYQDTLRGKFADQVGVSILSLTRSPISSRATVNMLHAS